jgi:hypothetical protein
MAEVRIQTQRSPVFPDLHHRINPQCNVQPKVKLVSYTGHVVVAAIAVVIALPFGLVALILAGKHKDVSVFVLVTQV